MHVSSEVVGKLGRREEPGATTNIRIINDQSLIGEYRISVTYNNQTQK